MIMQGDDYRGVTGAMRLIVRSRVPLILSFPPGEKGSSAGVGNIAVSQESPVCFRGFNLKTGHVQAGRAALRTSPVFRVNRELHWLTVEIHPKAEGRRSEGRPGTGIRMVEPRLQSPCRIFGQSQRRGQRKRLECPLPIARQFPHGLNSFAPPRTVPYQWRVRKQLIQCVEAPPHRHSAR